MKQYTYQSTHTRQRLRSSHSDLISLLLFYILPFIVINGIIFFLVTAKPKCEIAIGTTNDYITTDLTVTIKSLLPTKDLMVSINGEEITLDKTGRKTYTAAITQNGVTEVSLTNFNGMTSTIYEHVNILDDEPPAVASYFVEDGILNVTLSDSQSGVNFSNIYALDSNGARLSPLTVDKVTAQVTFSIDGAGLTMYASDMSGQTMEQPFSIGSSE